MRALLAAGVPVHAIGQQAHFVPGIAYAGLIVKDGNKKRLRTTLFTVNLATGATTSLGRIGGPWPLTSLTVLPTIALP